MKPKPGKSPARLDSEQTLATLKEAMEDRDYGQVDDLLREEPWLLQMHDSECESPLVTAVRLWDKRLVSICMKHGSSPQDHHLCPREQKPKNALLIAVEVFTSKSKDFKSGSDGYNKHFAIYTEIVQEMVCCEPFKQSGS